MKWREPWRQSITRQGLFPHVRRRLVNGFLVWLGIFAALVVVYALVGEIRWRDVPVRLAFVPAFALAMSTFLYLIWVLSPRIIDSGPRGIVLTKANETLLIPWQAISSFQFAQTTLPGLLLLRLRSGEKHIIVLSRNARPAEIAAEIKEMTGAQP